MRDLVLVLFVALVVVLDGCGSKDSQPPIEANDGTVNSKPAELAPADLMRRMVNAYHDMPRYRDEAVMVLSYRRNGQVERETAPMSVAAERPGRVSFSIYQTRMVCDGPRLRARISDPATADLDGQTLDLPAPERLSLPVLYGDPLLHAFLRDGLAGYPVQLELLFADEPLQPVMQHSDKFALLDEQMIDGHECRGVAAHVDSGRFVFWIDTREYLLRRLELPTDAMREALAGVDEIDQLQLTVAFTNATFPNNLPADAFRWSESPSDKPVGRFVLPASSLPTPQLGESVATFDLADLQGGAYSSESLRGASAVLVWFNDHPASRAVLEQVQQVARQVRGDGTHFVAVFADARGTPDQLRTLLDEWRIELPATLDQSAIGRDRLSIQEAPTLVLLDANQRLQVFQTRANPDLASQLPQWLARLQAGEDLAAEAIERHAADVARYQQELTAAMRLTDVVPVAAPAPRIAEAYPPRELKLTRIWQSSELTSPGNAVLLDTPNGPRAFVLDGFRTIVELDSQGTRVARHELELPPNIGVSRLRVATDDDGRRWVALFSTLGGQVFLFDDTWNRRLSYPPDDESQPGVYDAAFARDANDRLVLLVACNEPLGLHAIALDGGAAWINRRFNTVTSIAVQSAKRRILVTNELGELLPIDDAGRHDSPRPLGNWPLTRLVSHSDVQSENVSRLCGLSYEPNGRPVAAACDADLRELWTYPLPQAPLNSAVEPIVATDLLAGTGEWLFAGSDGSLHLVSCDGQFSDHFGRGTKITGIAARVWNNRPTLLICSPNGVECSALSVEP